MNLNTRNNPDICFKVEKTAESLFGQMKEPNDSTQRAIQEHIDEIAKPTGVNFWDLHEISEAHRSKNEKI